MERHNHCIVKYAASGQFAPLNAAFMSHNEQHQAIDIRTGEAIDVVYYAGAVTESEIEKQFAAFEAGRKAQGNTESDTPGVDTGTVEVNTNGATEQKRQPRWADSRNPFMRSTHNVCIELTRPAPDDMPGDMFHDGITIGAIMVRFTFNRPLDHRAVVSRFMNFFMQFRHELGVENDRIMSPNEVSLVVSKAIEKTCLAFGGGAGVFLNANSVVRISIAEGEHNNDE